VAYSIQHVECGTKTRSYYAKQAEKLKSMARGAARARYQANPQKLGPSIKLILTPKKLQLGFCITIYKEGYS